MIISILMALSSFQPALAEEHVFSAGKVFNADAKLKEPGVGPLELDSGTVEIQYQSNSNIGTGSPADFQPRSYNARVRFTRNPPQGKGHKEIPFSFDVLDVTSAKLGGAEGRTDKFGDYLSGASFVMALDEKGSPTLKNLDELKKTLSGKVTDKIAFSILETVLSLAVLDLPRYMAPDLSCLGGYVGAIPGKKWSHEAEMMITKIKFSCEFSGWSSANGKKIAIVTAATPRQAITSLAPDGKKIAMNIKEDGKIYFEPGSRELYGDFRADTIVSDVASGVSLMTATKTLRGHVFPASKVK